MLVLVLMLMLVLVLEDEQLKDEYEKKDVVSVDGGGDNNQYFASASGISSEDELRIIIVDRA